MNKILIRIIESSIRYARKCINFQFKIHMLKIELFYSLFFFNSIQTSYKSIKTMHIMFIANVAFKKKKQLNSLKDCILK